MNMETMELTIEYVQKYILENKFGLLPTQDKISFPLIKRYYEMLIDGKTPPPIKIDGRAIIDGHHRYISGHIHRSSPDICESIRPKGIEIRSWLNVIIDSADFNENYDSNRNFITN